MYHGKHDFSDFAAGNIENRISSQMVGKNPRKKRLVHIPDKILRTYHSFLNLFIFNHLPVDTSAVYSYRKGINVISAVRNHANSRHFYQTDISDFFNSITADIVTNCVRGGFEHIPVTDVEAYLTRIISLVTIDGKLPLGFSTSPTISNAVLLPLDNKLSAYCISKNLIYTRYSDDITISTREKSSLDELDDIIGNILSADWLLNFKINKNKTKITSIGRKIKILGAVILPNGHVSLDRKIKNKIETKLHLYLNKRDNIPEFSQLDLDETLDELSGFLNYANTIDSAYVDKLRYKYGVTVVDTLIHQPKNNDKKSGER